MRPVHTFDNGVTVYKDHCTPEQLIRYANTNLHEPDEEELFVSAIKDLPPGSCYLSVGTAIGYYAILAAKLRGDLRIVCFEPLPRHAACLRENWRLNDLPESRLETFEHAVSVNDQPTILTDTSFGSSITPAAGNVSPVARLKKQLKAIVRGDQSSPRLTVSCVPLRDVFTLLGVPVIGLVQMDVQGFEREIMDAYFAKSEGTTRGQISSFLVGTHGRDIHERCKELLVQHGYRLRFDQAESHAQPDGIIFAVFP